MLPDTFTATVPVNPPITVDFNLGRLEAIEEATGKTVNDLMLGEFREWVRAGDLSETAAARNKALRQVSAKVARRFIAGCLGCTLEVVDSLVPVGRMMDVTAALIGPFVRAVVCMNGGPQALEPKAEEAKQADPPTATASGG